ncbi:MAG TPA: hypothetical protein VF158_06710 [Longimicrobiales bacterium]
MIRLILYGIVGIVAIAVLLRLALAVLGPLLALAWFAAAKILPLVLLGWFVLWLWRRWKNQTA